MDYGTGENIIKCMQWVFIMLFICHWNACILYLVPTTGIAFETPVNRTIFTVDDSYKYSWYFTSGIEQKSIRQRYFWCLFKSMSHMLTIGYGVNTPNVISDLWTSVFVMFSK
jgi:hypothetical protein